MFSKELSHRAQDSGVAYHTKVDSISNILTQQSFSLLEERLRIKLTQHKIGEIVIRKEIETQLVQVQIPVRREKLIVEQVSPIYKRLAEIDLGKPNNSSHEIGNLISDNLMPANSDQESSFMEFDVLHEDLDGRIAPPTVYGSTDSLKAAIELLNALTSLPSHDCGVIRIEIALKDSKYSPDYQALVDQYCQT